MIERTRLFEDLPARLAVGDSAALRRLRARLEPTIASLVRRALLFPEDGSPLQAAVRSELRRLRLTDRAALLAADRQAVRLIAARICSSLIERFRASSPRSPARETIRDLAACS